MEQTFDDVSWLLCCSNKNTILNRCNTNYVNRFWNSSDVSLKCIEENRIQNRRKNSSKVSIVNFWISLCKETEEKSRGVFRGIQD
jgi:hypothetical protein